MNLGRWIAPMLIVFAGRGLWPVLKAMVVIGFFVMILVKLLHVLGLI